ncbi:MAG: hypothetical protein AAGL89_10620 [Pseudomonadota bacterium]
MTTLIRSKLNQTIGTAAVATLMAGALGPKAANAATFELFLIADHTTPVQTANALLEVTTQTVYQLGNFNNNDKARSIELVDNFTFGIDTALTVNSFTNPDPAQPTDAGEPGGGTAYMTSEVATWDNSGIAGTTPAADDQIDFGRNAPVLFNSVSGGFTDLVISDLGGLNPFALSLCSDATCDPSTSTVTQLFAGFSSTLTQNIIGLSDFSATDDPNDGGQDQTWLFRFDSPITSLVEILEFDNRNVFLGERLQADFVGAGGLTTTPPTPSPVPLPAGLPLLLSGLAVAGWVSRRRAS